MRILHTMLRVSDLDRSIKFYTDILGMQLLRKKDYTEGRFTLAFLGYNNEKESSVLELTHNWDVAQYEHGNAFGHIAIEVDNVYQACEQIKKLGGTIAREAGPMKHSTTVLAFVKDPDGYMIELLEAKRT